MRRGSIGLSSTNNFKVILILAILLIPTLGFINYIMNESGLVFSSELSINVFIMSGIVLLGLKLTNAAPKLNVFNGFLITIGIQIILLIIRFIMATWIYILIIVGVILIAIILYWYKYKK